VTPSSRAVSATPPRSCRVTPSSTANQEFGNVEAIRGGWWSSPKGAAVLSWSSIGDGGTGWSREAPVPSRTSLRRDSSRKRSAMPLRTAGSHGGVSLRTE
jgi:hypothetical protein